MPTDSPPDAHIEPPSAVLRGLYDTRVSLSRQSPNGSRSAVDMFWRVSHWTLERRGNIALATFPRPPRNLMHMGGMAELEQLVTRVAADDDIAVLVLTGGVDGYFVA